MKKLSDGYIFSTLLNGRNSSILENLKKPIRSIDVVTYDTIEDEFKNISKRFNTSLKEKILSQFLSGDIMLVHNTDYFKDVPSTIPTWTAMYKDKVVAVCNLTKFCSGSATKPLIQERELFAAMHYGYVMHEFAMNRGKYINNAEFRRLATTIYVDLFTKILDKLYSLKASPLNVATTRFNIATFFLINHFGIDNEKSVEELAFSVATKGFNANINMIKSASADLDNNAFDNIFTFCEAIKFLPGLARMDFKLFLQEYLVLFGEVNLLGLENLPLFVGNILTAVVSSRYVRASTIETVVGQQTMASFYSAFSR